MGTVIELSAQKHNKQAAIAINEDVYRGMTIDALVALQAGNTEQAVVILHDLLEELEMVIQETTCSQELK